ncbi:MAG: hypothetical protein RR334_03245, partial [Clostridia bacterium]
VTIFASSHSVLFKERKVGFSFKKGLYEYTNLGFIKILKNLTISKNSILVPNLIIEQNIPENSLVVNNKIIR